MLSPLVLSAPAGGRGGTLNKRRLILGCLLALSWWQRSNGHTLANRTESSLQRIVDAKIVDFEHKPWFWAQWVYQWAPAHLGLDPTEMWKSPHEGLTVRRTDFVSALDLLRGWGRSGAVAANATAAAADLETAPAMGGLRADTMGGLRADASTLKRDHMLLLAATSPAAAVRANATRSVIDEILDGPPQSDSGGLAFPGEEVLLQTGEQTLPRAWTKRCVSNNTT